MAYMHTFNPYLPVQCMQVYILQFFIISRYVQSLFACTMYASIYITIFHYITLYFFLLFFISSLLLPYVFLYLPANRFVYISQTNIISSVYFF